MIGKIRFSVRTLLLTTAFVAVLLCTIGRNYMRQFRIVENICDLGGKVQFCNAVKPPAWLLRFERNCGMVISNFVVSVDLSGTSATDKDLYQLVELDTVYVLDLSNTGITDDGMKSIAKMPHLRTLDLSGTLITDVGLERIAEMPMLYRVTLNGTNVSPECKVKLRTSSALDILP